ncbi:hypothetical protein N0V82_002413 [Gnomoniopsis sp. IMI 355080]|nr:hypothetical protein N0V82_002413 [Gnomoniopsis sp. IMI 355080]
MEPPTLLTMPPEIRNMIWTQALVRPEIHVAWVACEDALQKDHSHRTCYTFRYWSADIEGYTNGHGTYVGLQKQREDDILSRTLTIQSEKEVDNDQPYLNTLLLCRSVFAEAAPIFYSQNCFVFGGPPVTDEMTGSTPLLPAHAFLKDRSTDTLSMIKRIELQFIGGFYSNRHGWLYTYPFANYGLPTDDCEASIEQEESEEGLFPLFKTNLSLDYLRLSICGWSTTHKLPDETIFKSGINPVLAHLCDMNKVGRLAIKFTNHTELLETSPVESEYPTHCRKRCHVHSDHGSQCFARDATENDDLLEIEDGDFFLNPCEFTWNRLSGCSIAHETLRAAAFARLLRHHILENGEKKGYQDIKVLMGGGDTNFGQFIHVCTDDDKDGKSYLDEEQHQEMVSEYDIDPFASAGGSGILDEVQPHGWTPQWAVEEE